MLHQQAKVQYDSSTDLLQLVFAMFHGTFIFTNPPVYHWYLSVTAILLNASWSLHNVIAWIKNKPLLSRKASLFYIVSIILVQPYWVLEIVANVSLSQAQFDVGSAKSDFTVAILWRLEQPLCLHPALRSTIPRSVVDIYCP